ncbi:glycosyltransferase [Opitutaceae bacterium EW11]|nr:glycosyltransferase [Opitutaceae bacterium EW11]
MKLVIFGLTVSSSWGNGHATLWRGLCRALGDLGHTVVFFERDVPYYAEHRDLTSLPGARLELFRDWEEVLPLAHREVADSDVAMVTSYSPDGVAASELIVEAGGGLRVFYDLDTPVTLDEFKHGQPISYLGPRGLADFDLVLSYTGGEALEQLKTRLGARRVAPLYGSVDPDVHRPVEPAPEMLCDLSYLGTYAADRQPALEELFVKPARTLPDRKFLIGGAQYPADFPWTPNLYFLRHVEPRRHPAFYCSSRATLNVTRRAMKQMGYCPSGRLFEAAACGTPILSDDWEGLGEFFRVGEDILVARSGEEVVAALERSPEDLRRIGHQARERALAEHTAAHRAMELLSILENVRTQAVERGSMLEAR